MAKIVRKYNADVQEKLIECGGVSFLTLFGRHINGGFVAFTGYGVSAELSENDVSYNKQQIFAALKLSKNEWLPKSGAALKSIAEELAEVITEFLLNE